MQPQRSPQATPWDERTDSPDQLTQDDKAELGSTHEIDPHGSEHVRRGFLPWLCLIPALKDPRQYTPGMKWGLTFIVAMGGLVVPLSSGVLFPCLIEISQDMNTSVSVVNLSIAFGSLSVAITPLWWSYLAELYGRRLVYISSFLLLGLFSILSAISPNIGMFIAMRLLGSASSASLQAVSAGTISDLFEAKERGKAMGAFMLGPMLGPMFAPIIGGALTMNWSWRSTQWFMVIYGWAVFVVMVFFMPETATNLEENRRQNRNDASSPAKKVGYFLLKPMEAAKLLQYPPILITVYYTSIVFATYYLICVSIEDTFALPPYSWSSVIVGVAYIPGGLGLLCGAIVGGRWQDYIMARTAKKEGRYDDKGELILHPVDRLGENCLFAGILFPGALLWWGWAADKHTFWLVPLLGNFFYGVGGMILTNVTMTMLTEFTPKNSTIGVAVNNLMRNSLSCVSAIIAQPLFDAIGTGWSFTAVCLFCLLSGVPLILLRIKRDEWSRQMKATLGSE
ncbi:Major facilitator superfamily domain, general substrate transporter [Penicillium griseofulvum]|uniref:Major facilitator superfamily domain, general substrate transporter n=1 Tax=Penicillium patulum TaxID=5078 RepID=A0A135LKW6_PENPA|nr:Major facilitator superfamily domain, general substrate transporter [Penicillium griseofulvum]KXG49612.1 Major facilitator superfamily domain, general substrate transporter [Penicillium griseofulvum]